MSPEKKLAIADLLSQSFEEFPPHRHYYRQLPHFYWILEQDHDSLSVIKEKTNLPHVLGNVS
ncbi:MAG: hypothetical protein E4G98_03275, partial [Promethearchaeota archaeon]